MALYVTAVDENSPAERFGLTVGCALLAIDGHPLNDALDYQFYYNAHLVLPGSV
jgi:hypothetical protein